MPRIIAGSLGGRTIPGPPGKGTRPTSDRVREAVFSRLDGWDAIAGARVLDLYAGTGALALEALSRGAAEALLVEAHAPTAAALRRTSTDLGLGPRCEIRSGKAEQVAAQLAPTHGWGLVFLDPPYAVTTDALEELLSVLRPALAEDAVVVIERSRRSPAITWPAGFLDDGTKTYGDTVVHYGGPGTPQENS